MIITTVQLAMMVSVSAKQTIINESLLFVSGSFAHRRAALHEDERRPGWSASCEDRASGLRLNLRWWYSIE